MVKPIARELIAFQAGRFREAFKTPQPSGGDGPGADGADVDFNAWFTLVQKLEVNVFFLLNAGILNVHGIASPADLVRLGKARAAERRKLQQALNKDEETDISKDEFDRMCKLAAEVF